MPLEYQAQCLSCGHRGPVNPWGYQALVVDDARLVPLPHPYEARTLREQGTSFFMAGVEGRYARVDYRVCLDCGALAQHARLSFPVTLVGCLLVGLSLGLLWMAGALTRLPAWVMPMLGIGSWLGVTWVAAKLVRVLYRSRQRQLPLAVQCPHCGGTRLRDISSAIRQSLPCPKCNERSFQIFPVEMLPESIAPK
ncbi:MAG TPA: hypothetical protein PLJ27_05600 [Polyangiaceae bacterium]|jgi:hypothetical protein|nr:MAG: hypothetical protein BWY17_04763 [Deltaproteobacteria bacterium ADurb.Bin207]HNS98605.1 hypothetical protein [Polyangiaceae bacterium]HNZ25472.1 hypothetical protein [Polyangiaceae bacterium]HOD25207.1 hypothetical protein [Polyangiaceae bacterium]HOE51797.1 hypothetical protein [Polyangiaceae bacterium]